MEPKIRFDCSTALRAAPVRCTFDQQMTSEWMKNWCLSRWCCVGVRERRARGFSSRKIKETNDTHALQTHTCITQRTLYKYYHDHNQFSHHTAIAIHLFVRNGKKKKRKAAASVAAATVAMKTAHTSKSIDRLHSKRQRRNRTFEPNENSSFQLWFQSTI